MRTADRLLASGRDADIYEVSAGLVLRRSRDGRSLAPEAEVMDHVRRAGFPAPRVDDLQDDGAGLVMERVDGPLMGEAVLRQPWRLFEFARLLAELHRSLGSIPAPAGLRPLGDDGDSVVHLDLHPYNVIMASHGPVVIDWSSAARGRPETDVAATWVIIQCSEIPGSPMQSALSRLGRTAFLRSFLRHSAKEAAGHVLRAVISARISDPHVTDRERRYLVRWALSLEPSSQLSSAP
ncbi:MAG TPA: serine/threonine protein phosphatase [Acidimicrobiaceae bacterium]|nr:serine/threonine protein phosphatase [Acidimicrobiaceae bacterium]